TAGWSTRPSRTRRTGAWSTADADTYPRAHRGCRAPVQARPDGPRGPSLRGRRPGTPDGSRSPNRSGARCCRFPRESRDQIRAYRGRSSVGVGHAEFVVLGDDDLTGVGPTGRALRVPPDLEGPEGLFEGVKGQQASDQRVADPDQQL